MSSIGKGCIRYCKPEKLDFTVITDHSEFLDVMDECTIDQTSPNYDGNYCTSEICSVVNGFGT